MSDKVIRIASKQGFSDSWLNAATPTTLNLLDFTIPRGYNISLRDSYVAINAQIDNDSANPVNATMYLETDGATDLYNVPNSALIRNCSFSNDRGNVENIRRLDTLKCGLFGLENDAETRKNDLDTLSTYTGGRGIGNNTSYFLDSVTENVSNDGTTVDTAHTSRNISRDIKIPLNEMFGCCDTDAYSTDIFGETRIKIETNCDKLKSQMLGGDERTSLGFDGATPWGKMVDEASVANGTRLKVMAGSLPYADWQLTFPFVVGQEVLVSCTASAGASVTDVAVVITSIKYQDDNTAVPPTSSGVVEITTEPEFFHNTHGSDVDLSAILVKSKIDQVLKNVVNRADLVLHLTNEPSPQNIQFETYNVVEDNGNSLTSFNKGYVLEPEAKAILVACLKNSAILPNKVMDSYRYAIDNVEQTGNRSVNLVTAAGGQAQGSPIYYDRLQRCLINQLGKEFRNAHLKFYKGNSATQAGAYTSPVSMICETCEETQDSKMFNLNIESAGTVEQLILYKSVTKTM